VLRRNQWTDHFITGAELDRFIETETASNTEVLASIGLARDDQKVAEYAAVGPWTIPIVIALGFIGATVGALYERPGSRSASATARSPKARSASATARSPKERPPLQLIDWNTVAGFAAVLIVYILVLNTVGYLLATFAFLLVVPRLLGSKRVFRDLIFSAVTSVLVYTFFNFVLKVGLPVGILG
jgi:hypothetical protein